MPDYRSMFDREYIGAWDLPPGRDAVVVIREVKGAELTAQVTAADVDDLVKLCLEGGPL